MMNISLTGGKRPYEDPIDTETPPSKKQKLSPGEVVCSREIFNFCRWGETQLPLDVISHFVTFLPQRDFVKFSALAKGAISFTEVRFEEMRKQKQCHFACSFEAKESYPQRASYIFVRTLHRYVHEREALIKNPQALPVAPRPPEAQIKALYERFQSIMERFPSSLGKYIWKDLNSMASLQMDDGKLFLENSSSALPTSERSSSLAGDALLEGLSHLTTYCDLMWKANQNLAPMSLGKALPHLTHAMSSGAMITAYLAIKILSPLSSSTFEYCKNLASTSASYGDFKSLNHLLNKNIINAQQAYQSGLHYPPILTQIGIKQMEENHDAKQTEPLFEEAIKGYRDPAHVDGLTWLYAGINKYQLGKHKEAESLLENALEKKPSIPRAKMPTLWDYLMNTKMGLKKWQEAEKCGSQCLLSYSLYDQKIPLIYWASMAIINTGLKNWDEVHLYLDKTINSSDFNPTHPFYFKACLHIIDIKSAEEKWEEAERYIHLIVDRPNQGFHILVRTAKIKFYLKKWQEAKKYVDQALAVSPSEVPAHVQRLADKINAQCALHQTAQS